MAVPPPHRPLIQDDSVRKTFGGGVGGLCEALCLHPTDTVKTRLQLQRNTIHGLKYNGAMDCAGKVIAEEGFFALYKGLTPFSVHLVSKYSLRFFSHSFFRNTLSSSFNMPLSSPTLNFTSGMLAGIVEAVMIVTPFEVVKIRLQAQHGLKAHFLKYQGPVHAASTIVSEEGLFALWNGLTPTLFRNATNQAFNFMAFDYLKRLWGSEQNQLSFHQSILTGLVSGAIGPFINAPCDVIKTRLMQQDKSSAVRYSGFLDAFRTIWRDEGYLAFYKGFLPRISRIAPGQAITWTVVEQVNKLLS